LIRHKRECRVAPAATSLFFCRSSASHKEVITPWHFITPESPGVFRTPRLSRGRSLRLHHHPLPLDLHPPLYAVCAHLTPCTERAEAGLPVPPPAAELGEVPEGLVHVERSSAGRRPRAPSRPPPRPVDSGWSEIRDCWDISR
jgi:hypothetical protein